MILPEDLLYFNGIDGESGDYALPPMSAPELSSFIQGAQPPENLQELRSRRFRDTSRTFGPVEGVDPLKLSEAGWGIIFADNADPAIQEALQPLIALRRDQAGELFRLYAGADGYRAKESKTQFLARHGAAAGPVIPSRVPYYLLIVGSPKQIPYSFQTQLDVQYAVGRICFDALEGYENYARSVVAAESGQAARPRSAAFFGVAHPGDRATRMSAEHLAAPLGEKFRESLRGWEVRLWLRQQATKAQLARLLGGDQTPALLFSATHGMGFPLDSPRLLPHQGALLCQDWPGPLAWRGKGAIPQDFYFSGDDLAADASLLGMIAFFFVCYGAGTPRMDEFSRQAFKQPAPIAPYPFIARLPMRMLSQSRGGALAVIGHVERAWSYSFFWPEAGAQTAVFESCLQRLFKGYPVGWAFEYFNQRYAELSTTLSDRLEEADLGEPVDAHELAGLWTANNDARNYAILGGPAARLPAV
jgi:hypothetical protein